MLKFIATAAIILVFAGCQAMLPNSDVVTLALPKQEREARILEALKIIDSLGFVPTLHGGGDWVEFKDPESNEEILVRRFRHKSGMTGAYPSTMSLVLKPGRIRIIADRVRGIPTAQEIAKAFEAAWQRHILST